MSAKATPGADKIKRQKNVKNKMFIFFISVSLL